MLLLNGCSFVWGDELEGYENKPPTHWPHTFGHQLAEKLDIDYDNIAACGNCNQKIFRETVDYLTSSKDTPSHMMILWSDPIRKETLLEVKDSVETSEFETPRNMSMTQWHENRIEDLLLSMSENVAVKHSNHMLYNNLINFELERRTVDIFLSTFCTGMTHQLSLMLGMQTLCDSMGIKLVQGVFHLNVRTELNKFLNRIDREARVTSSQVVDWRKWVLETLDKLRPECQVGLVGSSKTLIDFNKSRRLKQYGHPDEQANKEFADYLETFFN